MRTQEMKMAGTKRKEKERGTKEGNQEMKRSLWWWKETFSPN
jgi:hypothetical protein